MKPISKLFTRSSSSSSSRTPKEKIPNEFLCSFTSTLMVDPVIIFTGDSFEKACMEACKELNFVPPFLIHALTSSLSSSSSSSSIDIASLPLRPNLNLKSAILHWCKSFNHKEPSPPSVADAYSHVRRLMTPDARNAADILERILMNLIMPDASSRRSGLSELVQVTTNNTALTTYFCTQSILEAIGVCLRSEDTSTQLIASRAILNLSSQQANKSKIARSSALCHLVHSLTTGTLDTSHNAAVAILNLAEEQENLQLIGGQGAIPPLLDMFCDALLPNGIRERAALALFRLSFCERYLRVLVDNGAARRLVEAAKDSSSAEIGKSALSLLQRLAEKVKGAEELMGEGAVREMVRMIRDGEGFDKYCLGVMYGIAKKNICERFKEEAVEAGAEAVLENRREEWDEEANVFADLLLEMIRGDGKNQEGKLDDENREQ